MRPVKPQKRAGYWYLIRRVPTQYKHLDARTFVRISTGIRIVDDPRGIQAARVVADLNASLEQDWLDLEAGREPSARRSYERARRSAEQLGLAYTPAADLVRDVTEVLRRLEVLERGGRAEDAHAVDGALGLVDKPDMKLSELFPAYRDEQAASVVDMSAGQIKRWETNKLRPLQTLIGIIGDKSVLQLTREDGLKFRKFWQERVKAKKILITSANKEIGSVVKMLRVVEKERQLGIPLEAFADLRIEGGKERQRPAFEQEFIRNVLLAPGALDGLNDEARAVVHVVAGTGLRPVEVANLLPRNIHLGAKVPYVSIRPDGRKMKTDQSERDMPLAGVALEAMKRHPKGFPRYLDKGDVLSAAVNKYLRNNGLLPTPRHSLYSLRHSFEDRLTALDAPEKIIAVLMGHKQTREKYGNGPSLEHLQGWIKRVAFDPPAAR